MSSAQGIGGGQVGWSWIRWLWDSSGVEAGCWSQSVLHLIRNLASRADWDRMARGLRPVYTAVNEPDAATTLAEFHDTWGQQYPAFRGL